MRELEAITELAEAIASAETLDELLPEVAGACPRAAAARPPATCTCSSRGARS